MSQYTMVKELMGAGVPLSKAYALSAMGLSVEDTYMLNDFVRSVENESSEWAYVHEHMLEVGLIDNNTTDAEALSILIPIVFDGVIDRDRDSVLVMLRLQERIDTTAVLAYTIAILGFCGSDCVRAWEQNQSVIVGVMQNGLVKTLERYHENATN